MRITEAKLSAKIKNAWKSYILVGHLQVAVLSTDLPLDEGERLWDKLSAVSDKLKGRYDALKSLYDDLREETYHIESTCRMWDSYHKYRALAESLTAQEEMRRATA